MAHQVVAVMYATYAQMVGYAQTRQIWGEETSNRGRL